MDLDDAVDELIKKNAKQATDDELVSTIDDSIFFRRNSVNLVIGRRSSGKTHTVLREIIKCLMLAKTNKDVPPYTQVWYVSDKQSDDTVEKLRPLIEKYVQFSWIETNDAMQLFKALELGKAQINEDGFAGCLNAEHLPRGVIPHTFVLFDDAIGQFSRTTELARKLYQTRQSRITAFLMLQDVNGLNASMKSNVNSLVLFGGFPKHKLDVLLYQMPPIEDFTFEDYAMLSPRDCIIADFEDGSLDTRIRA